MDPNIMISDSPLGEIWNDECNMPRSSDHRILSINLALSSMIAWMRMYVRNDKDVVLATVLIQSVIADAVKVDATSEAVWIEIVVKDKLGYGRAAPFR